MSENSHADTFAGGTTQRGCDRAEDFVAYLYGEAPPAEARAFRRHLEACAVCREELAALGGVREGLGLWRAEALGSLPSLDIGAALAGAHAAHQPAERRRSAVAAFREFFSLSPLWLRAGALAAALVFCALAALTLARAEVRWGADGLAFRAGGGERVIKEQVRVPVQSGYTAEQVEAIVAQRVAEVKTQSKERQTPQVVETSDTNGRSRAQAEGANARQRRRPARNRARRDEEMLAEDSLPRLSDLLDGSY